MVCVRGLSFSRSFSSDLFCRTREDLSISVPSGGIQSILEDADADVILLLDCCHSAAVTTKDSLQGTGGVTEVIAACGYETRAAEVDQHSFTKSLTEVLAVASKGPPFSVGELHSWVLAISMNRMAGWPLSAGLEGLQYTASSVSLRLVEVLSSGPCLRRHDHQKSIQAEILSL